MNDGLYGVKHSNLTVCVMQPPNVSVTNKQRHYKISECLIAEITEKVKNMGRQQTSNNRHHLVTLVVFSAGDCIMLYQSFG